MKRAVAWAGFFVILAMFLPRIPATMAGLLALSLIVFIFHPSE